MSASGNYQLISRFISDGSTTFVTFSSIPTDKYYGIVAVMSVKQSGSTAFPYGAFTINDDNTASIYNGTSFFMSGYDYGAQILSSYNTGDNQVYFSRHPESSTTGDPRWSANSFGHYAFFFPNAGSTAQHKSIIIQNSSSNNVSTPYFVGQSAATYKSLNRVTKLSIGLASAFISGTTVNLYGYNT
jgi:hypothetical protein